MGYATCCYWTFSCHAEADVPRGYACTAIAEGHTTLALTEWIGIGLSFAVLTKQLPVRG
jgi:hypothetical protein